MILVTNHQATVVLEPGKQPLRFPSFPKSSQDTPILRDSLFPIMLMRSNQLYTAFFRQPAIQFITVIRSVANHFVRDMLKKTGIQGLFNQLYFMRSSTGRVNGDRKTTSVCEAHNFGAFALFGFAHTIAPFLAGAKVPSIKPSLRSIPPRSFRSRASAVNILANTPDSVHRWKCRWQVLLGGYQAARLYVNYFQPSFKLHDKSRDGYRVKRSYEPPATPCDRLLKHPAIQEQIKEKLQFQRQQLDPVKLLHCIRQGRSALTVLTSTALAAQGPERESLEQFLSQLPRLWRDGEVRSTHRSTSSKPHYWRNRFLSRTPKNP